MKIKTLLDNLNQYTLLGEKDAEISNLTDNSKSCVKGSMFFCLKGKNKDGEDYVKEAVFLGAAAIVTEERLEGVNCAQIVVDDARKAYSIISAAFYDNPQKDMKIVGVVGTNGKTSICHVIGHILEKSGKKCGVIGTIGSQYGGKTYAQELTTPDPPELFARLFDMKSQGVEIAVMELSAHAIYLKKAAAIDFEILIFTNCTRDHLDYFENFEQYKNVKKSAFSKSARFFVVNADDNLGAEIYLENPKKTVTYGINSPCDVFAVDVNESQISTSFVVNIFDMIYEAETKLLGEFNVVNILASISACFLLGLNPRKAISSLKDLPPIRGRMELITTINGANVFVDYAHTPDGVDKSLSFLAATCEGDTYCILGAGGNRDKPKRYFMGKIAGEIADFVIITSDNPRFEEPSAIIKDLENGIRQSTRDYICIQDRRAAIRYAVKLLKAGDCLLIAGKGAEEYQEVLGVRHYFSDKKEVLALKELMTGEASDK